jgi:hypothetical protein
MEEGSGIGWSTPRWRSRLQVEPLAALSKQAQGQGQEQPARCEATYLPWPGRARSIEQGGHRRPQGGTGGMEVQKFAMHARPGAWRGGLPGVNRRVGSLPK